jgi:flagellar hook-associated protein 2
MGIGVGGLISGLDTETIITSMMEVERQPIVRLQRDEAFYLSKISAVGILSSALSSLQSSLTPLMDADNFSDYSVSSSNTSVLSVASSGDATLGDYQVEVTALAQAQQVRSSAFTASDEIVGTGTLTIQVGIGDAVDITIDSDSETLEGIAEAINAADTDVNAAVVDDGNDNFYLTLVSKETGLDNTISLTMTDDDGIDTDASGLSSLYTDPATSSLTETFAAANTELTVNGIDVVRATKTIDDLIEGLTLTVNAEDTGNPFTITVAEDLSSVTTNVQSFVTQYNSLVSSFATLQSYDAETGASGTLQGDSTTRMIHTRIQSLLHTEVDGVADEVNGLSYLGIEIDDDGYMSLDTDVLTTALEDNRTDVVNFFSQEEDAGDGFAIQLSDVLDGYLGSTGVLSAKEDGLNSSIDNITDQIDSINYRLVKKEETLRQQFLALETLLAQFENTSGVLAGQLESLANLNSQIYNK